MACQLSREQTPADGAPQRAEPAHSTAKIPYTTQRDAIAKRQLVFVVRLLATLVHLRHAATHDVLASWFGVDRSTITRAIGEVRPLLAERGCTISTGVRLRTLAEVIDHIGASRKSGIIDGTEIRVRRPAAGRKDRDKFISGKSKQNAVKTMVVTDGDGRMLFCSPTQHGSCADITHARQLGLVRLLGGRSGSRDPRGCRLPGPGSPDRWARGDTAAPQVQEERPPTDTRRRTNDSAKHTPHAASGSNTALRT
ncbi:transposase family protein [Streptomyces anthocyanicus]|uniref:transposase family protein n=1 Tax=Streptomyces anthocyanicus TaxID=68174 RepID=UPI003644B196